VPGHDVVPCIKVNQSRIRGFLVRREQAAQAAFQPLERFSLALIDTSVC
jgi:hypothetical protein